jgi:sugar/nucleoside kinase (ribokinase family)
MALVGVVGQVSRDLVGEEARLGGPVLYASRALARADAAFVAATKCTPAEAELLGPRVSCLPAESVPAFSFHYDGEVREMTVEALGEPWTPGDLERLPALPGWVQVGAVTRSDFPAATVAALARGRRLALDAHGLARVPRLGPLALDGAFDPALLEHLAVLKLAEEEALAIAGGTEPAALRALGVPEVVLTFGSRGALVVTPEGAERVDARRAPGLDPTGAGDVFLAGYVLARAGGIDPVGAAHRGAALVAETLAS